MVAYKVCHTNCLWGALIDDGKGTKLLNVAGEFVFDSFQEEVVDEEDDVEVTWENLSKEINPPFLKRFRQNSMIGIRKSPITNLKSLLPITIKTKEMN